MCVETAKWNVIQWDDKSKKIVWQCANCNQIKVTSLTYANVEAERIVEEILDSKDLLSKARKR